MQLGRVMRIWVGTRKLFHGGGFDLMYKSPVELQLDTVTSEIFKRVRDNKVKRVVIDALGDLEHSSIDKQRFSDFIYAMTQWFAAENVTCLMMHELAHLFEVHGISDLTSRQATSILLRSVRIERQRT